MCMCEQYDFTIYSVGAVNAIEWACVLCGCPIQNDWASRATNLHHILCQAWTFLHRNYSDDSEGHSYNWWLAVHHDNASVHASRLMQSFWWNMKSSRWLSPLQPRFGALQLLAFPQTKVNCESKEISDHWWVLGKYDGAADDHLGELCEVPRCLNWRGLRCHCFLNLVSSSINVSFIAHGWMLSGPPICFLSPFHRFSNVGKNIT